jgi:hypothetical protein
MNRVAKISCWLAVAEMTVVAAIALAVRWPDIVHHRTALSAFEWRKVFALCFFPPWAALAVVTTARKLQPKGMDHSAGYHCLVGIALVMACLFGSGMQAWTAAIFVFQDPTLLQVSPQGVGMLLAGVFFLVYGNATAKLDPPTGPAAPEPGAWIRGHLRSGWTIVLLGIVMMAGAFAPPVGRVAIGLVAIPVAVANVMMSRRMLRNAGRPRAPA